MVNGNNLHIIQYTISIKECGLVTIFASIISYCIIENYLKIAEDVFDFLPQFILIVILGGSIYFGITYAIDESVKKLFKLIWKEILKK